ncbi:phage tail protein [Geodermatophilus sp. SYSU D00742]
MPADDRQDPFLAFRFEVRLAGLPAAGFSDCSGLIIETEVQDHPEGGLNDAVHKLIGRTKQANLVLKRGIVDRRIWDWYADLIAGRVTTRNGSVVIRSLDGAEAVAEWEFSNALPVKWSGPDLNANQSAIAVETVELVHGGLRRRT